jgi:uncharacterized membrane protein YgdD (TMEM256/DUF423 family)
MRSPWFGLGMAFAALGVGGGAMGAHGLRSLLDARHLELWQTASHYLLYTGLSLALVGVAAELRPSRGWGVAGSALFLGGAIFSSTVAALALGGAPWLGAVTPVGGALIILGLITAALAALKR